MTSRNVLNFPPEGYQETGIRFGLLHHYHILGDEMGLGKTFQAIAVAELTSKRTLIVCPSYLKFNWYAELEKFRKAGINNVKVLKTGKDFEQDFTNTEYIIMSYSMLKYAKRIFDWATFVVADEAHYLKNMEAQRTKYFHRFLYEAETERCALLSGTPIQNRITEWFSLLKLCSYSPKKTNGWDISQDYPNTWKFNSTFSKARRINIGGRTITKFEGMRNVDLLKKYLSLKYIRRLAKNVLSLEEMIEKQVVVEYKDDKELGEAWSTNNSRRDASSTAKANSALLKSYYTAKYLKDLLAEGEGPLVVFTAHLDSLRNIETILKKDKKLRLAVWDGSTDATRRAEAVRDFQAGRKDVILCTIKSGNTGFNMTRAKHVIFNDESWVPGENDQACKRIHRYGQDKVCTAHYIIGSIQDKMIADSLSEKREVLRRAM